MSPSKVQKQTRLPFAFRVRLSQTELLTVIEHVAQLVHNQLPLVSGLQALAAEYPQHRIGRSLLAISLAIESGQDLPTAIRQLGVSDEVMSLVLSNPQVGLVNPALKSTIEHLRQARDSRRQLWISIAYPLFLCLLCVGVLVLVSLAVLPDIDELYTSFGFELAIGSKMLFGFSRIMQKHGYWCLIAVFLAGGLLLRFRGKGPLKRQRRLLLHYTPFFGRLRKSRSLAAFNRSMSELLAKNVLLHKAVLMAAETTGDSLLKPEAAVFSAWLQAGAGFKFESHGRTRFFPPVYRARFKTSGDAESLIEFCRAQTRNHLTHLQYRCLMLPAVLEPLIVLLIGMIVLGIFYLLTKPLFDMLSLFT